MKRDKYRNPVGWFDEGDGFRFKSAVSGGPFFKRYIYSYATLCTLRFILLPLPNPFPFPHEKKISLSLSLSLSSLSLLEFGGMFN